MNEKKELWNYIRNIKVVLHYSDTTSLLLFFLARVYILLIYIYLTFSTIESFHATNER